MRHHRVFFICGAVFLVSVVFSTAEAQSLNHSWSERFGDGSTQDSQSTATDGSGNVIVAGKLVGTMDFGGGPLTSVGAQDVYIAKFDVAGNHVWSKRFGDSDAQNGDDVETDGFGNVIVTGTYRGTVDFGGGPLTSAGSWDIFIAKFDAAGNHLWSNRYGDANQQTPTALAIDSYQNVIVTGFFYGTVDFGGGPLTSAGSPSIFIAKFDAAGNHLWSQRFGDGGRHFPRSIETDASGNVVVTGEFEGTVDFGGGPLTSAGYGDDIFLAKFDAAGNHLWSQRFGDGNDQYARSIAIDASGNVVVTGEFEGTVDFGGGPLTSAGYGDDIFLAKFDAAGNHLWSRRFGEDEYQGASAIAIDPWGNLVATGSFKGTVDFGGGLLTSAGANDVFIATFNAFGYHLWSQRFGDESFQTARYMATDASGNVIVTGWLEGTMDFGGGPLTSAGSRDIFVASFAVDRPIPTILQAFDARCGAEAVELSWRLSEVGREARFFVLRSESDRPFAELHAAGTEIDGLNAAFTDRSVEAGKTYRYRVDVSDENGRRVLFTTQEITIPVAELTLGPAQPNPFNPQTLISYSVPEATHVRLIVYDARGALVRTLVDGVVPSGARSATWNGRDDGGELVSSGVYFVRLESGGKVRTNKIVLLK